MIRSRRHYEMAPDRLGESLLSRRHKMMVDFEFCSLGTSEERVDAVTESAFELGLITLVQECAAAGRLAQPATTRAAKS